MLKVGILALTGLTAALVAVLGCGPNSYAIARMTPRELKTVADADLRYAQRSWQSPQLLEEIRLRTETPARESFRRVPAGVAASTSMRKLSRSHALRPGPTGSCV